MTSGKKQWGDGTLVGGQQFEYGFDDIGNRTSSARGGDQTGAGLTEYAYTPNLLNQYGSRTVPGVVDVLGTAVTNATVTVNLNRADRKGEYFHGTALLNNLTNAIFGYLTNLAVLNNGTNADIIATNITGVFLPVAEETFTYDDDGNLLQDGRWDLAPRALRFWCPI